MSKPITSVIQGERSQLAVETEDKLGQGPALGTGRRHLCAC
jgi:hypothetical protein